MTFIPEIQFSLFFLDLYYTKKVYFKEAFLNGCCSKLLHLPVGRPNFARLHFNIEL